MESTEKPLLKDKSGRRRGIERRQYSYTIYIPERRSGLDRRSGEDRRRHPRIPVKNRGALSHRTHLHPTE